MSVPKWCRKNTIEQKHIRKNKCLDLLERIAKWAAFLWSCDHKWWTWIFEYDPEAKRQSEEWHTANSPWPKKAGMNKSKIKSKLIWFFDKKGIIHKEFVPSGQTINQPKTYLKGSEKGSFTWDQIMQTNGCSIMTMPHITLLHNRIFDLKRCYNN